MSKGITEQVTISSDIVGHEIDLFRDADVINSYKRRYTIKVNPSTSLDSGPIEFVQNIPHEACLDLYNITCFFWVKIQNSAGEDIEPTTDPRPVVINLADDRSNQAAYDIRKKAIFDWDDKLYCPVNNFGHSLFKDMQMFIGAHQLPSPCSGLYPIVSFLQTLLTYSKDTKNTRLKQQLWVEDYGKNTDVFNGADGFCQNEMITNNQTRQQMHNMKEMYSDTGIKNPGAFERFDIASFSKIIPISIKPCHPLLHQERILPGGRQITLKFFRNSPEFCLMSKNSENTKGYKIVIVKAQCNLVYIEPNEDLLTAIFQNHIKNNKPFTYPIISSNIFHKSYNTGSTDLSCYDFTRGILPKKGLIVNVRTDAFYGSYNYNPFYFPHLNVSQLVINKNGKALNHDFYEFDFDNNDYLMGYQSIYELLSILNKDSGISIDYKQYKHGMTIYGFNLCKSDNDADLPQEPSEIGTMDMTMKVSTPIPYPITTIIYLDYQEILDIHTDGSFTIKNIQQS